MHARPTPTEVVRAFSPPDPAPVLAGVKVVRPVGRSTLTPAAAGVDSQQREGTDIPPLIQGVVLPRSLLHPLTRPDPMGAGMLMGSWLVVVE